MWNKKCGLNLPEQLHNIIEIYPSVPVEIKIKCAGRLGRCNPRHMIEHEHDIVEVFAIVGIQVLGETIAVGIITDIP
jgi:hypothetical protein